MADRDKKLSVYVTEQRKREIQQRADDEGMTVSTYLNQLIEREMIREAKNEVAIQTQAVEQLQRTIDQGTRQLRDVADDIRDLQARTGVYSVANFELLKQDYPQSRIDDAMSAGSRRLRGEAPDNGDAETNGGDDYDVNNPLQWRDNEEDE